MCVMCTVCVFNILCVLRVPLVIIGDISTDGKTTQNRQLNTYKIGPVMYCLVAWLPK